MRLFIAIELSPGMRKELQRIGELLERRFGDGLRIMPPENLHLTLKFIGEFKEAFLPELYQLVRAITDSAPSFEIALASSGAFPARGAARVCWVSLRSSSATPEHLYRELNEQLDVLDVKREDRDFKPHVTIARPGRMPPEEKRLREFLESLKVEPLRHTVESLTLFSSKLGPRGSTYEVLERFRLNGVRDL